MAIFPEVGIRAAAAYPKIFESLAFTTIMGLKAAPKSPTRSKSDIWSKVSLASVNIAKIKVSIKQVPVQTTSQITKQRQATAQIQNPLLRFMFGFDVPTVPPSQITRLLPLRRREDERKKRGKRKRKTTPIGFRAGVLTYELKGLRKFLQTMVAG